METTRSGPSPGLNLQIPVLTEIDDARIRDLLAQDHFFWLDLEAPEEAQLDHLGELLGFHPLSVESAKGTGQRPKLDDFGDHIHLIFYGACHHHADEEPLREVHMFASGGYLVTAHRDCITEIEDLRGQIAGRVLRSEQFLVYRVLDTLTDSFFPLLAKIDEEIDALEDAIIAQPTDEQLQRIFSIKRDLVAMRKVVTPQRDLLARSIDQLAELPGLEADERDYFRDVYDHMIRISDLVDSYRDLLGGAMDVYLSTVSNRQNEVMRQLAIIATIFLPLSFLTGFFGMNFGWLLSSAQKPTWTFFALGIGSMLAALAVLAAFFRRKGWL